MQISDYRTTKTVNHPQVFQQLVGCFFFFFFHETEMLIGWQEENIDEMFLVQEGCESKGETELRVPTSQR